MVGIFEGIGNFFESIFGGGSMNSGEDSSGLFGSGSDHNGLFSKISNAQQSIEEGRSNYGLDNGNQAFLTETFYGEDEYG